MRKDLGIAAADDDCVTAAARVERKKEKGIHGRPETRMLRTTARPDPGFQLYTSLVRLPFCNISTGRSKITFCGTL